MDCVKSVFSKKDTKIDEIFTVHLMHLLHNVKSTVKISSIFVANSENMNFTPRGVIFQADIGFSFSSYRKKNSRGQISLA